jgi:hypothetical protein
MATVANYVVISDNPTDLKIGDNADNSKEFTFSIPNNAAVTAQHSILSLMVNSMGTVKALKANISINGVNVWGYGPTDTDFTRPFHEVVRASDQALKIGSNMLRVKLESGQGTFRVSDIVVWFQNNA